MAWKRFPHHPTSHWWTSFTKITSAMRSVGELFAKVVEQTIGSPVTWDGSCDVTVLVLKKAANKPILTPSNNTFEHRLTHFDTNVSPMAFKVLNRCCSKDVEMSSFNAIIFKVWGFVFLKYPHGNVILTSLYVKTVSPGKCWALFDNIWSG